MEPLVFAEPIQEHLDACSTPERFGSGDPTNVAFIAAARAVDDFFGTEKLCLTVEAEDPVT